nr:hypothetical protein [Rhodoferax sp.]
MSQVTIYLEDDALAAAKEAAARSKLSVSKWFAQFAEAEKARNASDWGTFWAEIDAKKKTGDESAWDFLLNPKSRYAGLGQDIPRESMD